MMADDKDGPSHIGDDKASICEGQFQDHKLGGLPKPDTLRNLADEEITIRIKKLVGKMDLFSKYSSFFVLIPCW